MAELGNKRKVYVGSSSDAYSWLTGEQTNNFSINNNVVEISDKSSEYQNYIGGLKGGSGSVSVYADDANAQQISLITSLTQGAKVKIFVGTLGSSGLTGAVGWSFEAIITSISDTNDNGSVSTRDFAYNTCGAITHHPGTE